MLLMLLQQQRTADGRNCRHLESATAKSKIRLHQSMRIYFKNNSVKFHPDSI